LLLLLLLPRLLMPLLASTSATLHGCDIRLTLAAAAAAAVPT
jgi:hypothetical protein